MIMKILMVIIVVIVTMMKIMILIIIIMIIVTDDDYDHIIYNVTFSSAQYVEHVYSCSFGIVTNQ